MKDIPILLIKYKISKDTIMKIFMHSKTVVLISFLFLLSAFNLNATNTHYLTGQTGQVTIFDVDYVDNMSEIYYINTGVSNKPISLEINLDVENGCDGLDIYSIDAAGNVSAQPIASYSGYYMNTIISTVIPSGRVKLVFYSDSSASNDCGYTGLELYYSVDNSFTSTENSYVTGNSIVVGNLGVGTTNPTAKLDVEGTGVVGKIIQTEAWNGGNYALTVSGYSDFNGMRINGNSGIRSIYSLNQIDLAVGNSSPITFTQNITTERMRIASNGYLGIGTTTPSSPLTIRKTISSLESHLSFGDLAATSGQVSARLCFAGSGVQHAGFAWVPNSNMTDGKMHLAFGGYENPMSNSIKVTFQSNGRVGIGTTTPQSTLDVAGNAGFLNKISIVGTGETGSEVHLINTTKTTSGQAYRWSIFNMTGSYGNSLQFWFYDQLGTTFQSGGKWGNVLTLMDNGNVGIGTNSPNINDKLTVNGTIHAKEVKVDLDGLADYVFDSSYKLMPLYQVESYVNTNNHLPDMPSASEVSKNGLSMGEMQNKLLQKVEELTLYMIEQQKTINAQNAKIEELEKRVK
jgi:hypothetical protein